MSVSLSSLVTRLQGAVSARDGVPSSAQYQQAVKDAVADFSRRAPMQKLVTLSMISGAATYDLPDDFIKIIQVASLVNPSGVIISATGIIPVSAEYTRERWTVAGRKITFYPTPAYTISRDVWYSAGYVLDDDDAYADLTDEDASVALLLAQAIALDLKANKAADDAWNYQIGDERVSKEKLAAELRGQAKEMETKYLNAVNTKIGAVGMRSDYDWYDAAKFGL